MFAPEVLREIQGWPGDGFGFDMLPYGGQDPLPDTPYHTPDLRNAWYHIHHVVLGKSVWKFWQLESKRPSTAAMFNTSHPEAVLWAYNLLTHICINRVSMPQNWYPLSGLISTVYLFSQLAPVHLFRVSRMGPLYLLFLIARMLSLSTVSWLYFIAFLWLKCYLIGDSFEIISHGLTRWLSRSSGLWHEPGNMNLIMESI